MKLKARSVRSVGQLRRWIRERLSKKYGTEVFDRKLAQLIGGFTKSGNVVLDHLLDGTTISYEFGTAIGWQLFWYGSFEESEIRFVESMLRTRPYVGAIIDVGANIGLHSLRLSKSFSKADLYAFEPSPPTFMNLQQNIKRSGQNNIIALPYALSNQVCEKEFFHCEDNAYSSLIDTHRKNVKSVFRVAVTTLDQIVEEQRIQDVSLIKIDVEGLESEVVLGATKTIQKFHPDIFVEIYGGTNSNPEPARTVEILRALGYQAYVLTEGTAAPYKEHSDEFYNYYFSVNRIQLDPSLTR